MLLLLRLLDDGGGRTAPGDVVTVGSLFSGIGGFDLGFERAGFEIRWQVEIDPFCRAVLAKHWSDVRRYEDVRRVHGYDGNDAGPCAGCLVPVDYIVGGFPCQDLSSAGKRAGVNGIRSGLWREFMRVVGDLRPRGVVIENVHHAWRGWVPVLRRALWERGYASLPLRVRASDFGARHERSRVFLVAHVDPRLLRLESWRRGWPFWEDPPLFADTDQAGCADGEGLSADAGIVGQRSVVADIDTVRQLQPEGRIGDEWRRSIYGAGWATEPDVVRVVHGVSSRLDRRRAVARIAALGNAVIPEEVEWIAERILEAEKVIAHD